MAKTLTPGQERFARIVSQGTGLELPTVRAWVNAESGGRTDRDWNPLSILTYSGKLQNYGTPEGAAAATIKLLRTKTYEPLLKTARDPRKSVAAELYAIVQSPWEGSHYKDGILLAGAYKALYPQGKAVIPGSGIGEAQDAVRDVVNEPVNAAKGAVSDAASWAENVAGKALLYVVLSGLALALVVMGVARSLGVGPREAVGVATRGMARPAPAGDDIPF